MAKMTTEDVIVITTNQEGFEYDIHSLVKAFYPACQVKVRRCQEDGGLKGGEGKEDELHSGGDLPELEVRFSEEAVFVTFVGGGAGSASFGGRKAKLYKGMPRQEVKNRLKQVLYETLSEYTGRNLPWGTLTGIRPVKIPMGMLEEGRT